MCMTIINLGGVDYETDKLSENARAQVASIQAVDRKLADLQAELAFLQTARAAYLSVLKQELNLGDTASE